jgi:hypothetical protein
MSRQYQDILKSGLSALLIASGSLLSVQPAAAQSDSTSPMVNFSALRGVSTVLSAVPMGNGRLTINTFGTRYQQEQGGMITEPATNAVIFTGIAAFSYGIGNEYSVFGSIAGFGSNEYTNTSRKAGLGTITAGFRGAIPAPDDAALRVGGQLAIIGGTSENQINTNRADGYNYFETRNGYDVMGTVMQTIVMSGPVYNVKLHFNEAAVMTLDQDKNSLMLLGIGVQGNIIPYITTGVELNSRTEVNDLSVWTDPLWVTPTISLRTPYQMNIKVGADVSLSQDRSAGQPQALEPYRIFGAVTYSFDMLASQKKRFAAQQKEEARAKADQDKIDQMQIDNNAQQAQSKADQAKMGQMQADSKAQQAQADDNAQQALIPGKCRRKWTKCRTIKTRNRWPSIL